MGFSLQKLGKLLASQPTIEAADKATDLKTLYLEAQGGNEKSFASFVKSSMEPDNKLRVFEHLVQLAQFKADQLPKNSPLRDDLKQALQVSINRELIGATDDQIADIKDGANRLAVTPGFEKLGRSFQARIGGEAPIPVASRADRAPSTNRLS